jgi:hypothetical protein
LSFYGTEGVSEDWFRSCLSNRRQKVDIKSPNTTKRFFSDWGILKHVLPQGSILGLLLFIICINALPLRICPVTGTVLFADGTSVIISSRNFEISVQCQIQFPVV